LRIFWVTGIALAATGVLLARVISGMITDPVAQYAAFVAGVLLAIAGLGVVLFGLNRKSRQNRPKP
jgi:hypothetical protein